MPEPFWGLACMGKAKQGRGNSLGLAFLTVLEATGYRGGLQLYATWPWVIQGTGNVGLVCLSQVKEVVEGMDLGLVGFYMKCGLTNRLFTVSMNQLALGGAISPQAARPSKVVKTS